jgi:molybdenum cofactor guanylyltransferase
VATSVSGAILSGGRAQRFDGRDKGQLRVGGITILERQVQALRTCVERIVLVGQATRPDGPGVAAQLPVVSDRTPGCGPLGGLDAALAAGGGGSVLLLACDMPFVTGPFLSFLIGELGDADAVVPRTEHGYHPLCAVFATSCAAPVRRRLDERRLRVRDLVDELRVRVVDTAEIERFGEPTRLLANVNTQADLDALESLQNH